MYAIVETGGKQYRADEQGTIEVERLPQDIGEEVALDRVLLVEREGQLSVGDPVVPGARVVCRVVAQDRGPKIVVFKYKAKKNYRRKAGHRQAFSRLLVERIELA
jgi:large subunit ribosomal protein L21